ncbi:hypothetical protein SAMN06309944_0241 [Micrococcales bacterium KH10]|nr:hypothetical protein SAMN06309944_0241 [Micrococcales bacterium KH10]
MSETDHTARPLIARAETTAALIEQLYQAARELTTTDLLPRLKALIAETSSPNTSDTHRFKKQPSSPAPWNDAAAGLYYTIHGDARRFETLLSVRLFGRARFRPGADNQTVEAIGRLPVLIAHGYERGLDPDLDLADPTNALLSWPRQIRAMLDAALPGEEPWTTAPGDLRCPHCDNRLHLEPGWTAHPDTADVICRHCRDDNGKHLRWAPTTWVAVLQHQDTK